MQRRDALVNLGIGAAAMGLGQSALSEAAAEHHEHGDHGKMPPVDHINLYFCGFHIAKSNPGFQLQTQHYCCAHGDGMYQCVLYDKRTPDAKLLCQAGVAGLAFGFLRNGREIDLARTRELVRIAGELDSVFHRAFDSVFDPHVACQQLAEIGVSRLLTSGQAADALAGAVLLRELCELTINRLEIMPGGGIRSGNAWEVIQQTGCRQLHTGAETMITDESLNAQAHGLTIDSKHSAAASTSWV